MTRRAGARSVVLACAVGAAGCGAAMEGTASDRERTSVVEPAVVEALRAHGSVNVLVALVAPDGADADDADDAIARWQDEVLAELAPADFQLRHRYEAVAALAGKVLSERGLAVLRAHPRVVRVGLDAGGGGATDHGSRVSDRGHTGLEGDG